jgi:hypothetical protein
MWLNRARQVTLRSDEMTDASKVFLRETAAVGGPLPRDLMPERVKDFYDEIAGRADALIGRAREAIDGLLPIHFGFIHNGEINAVAFRSDGRTKVARLAVKFSGGLSLFQSSLILLFATINVEGFRSVLTAPYVLAYAVAAYFTLRMSCVAATVSLLLYLTMRHGNCEALHLTFFLIVCSIYAAGIWGTAKLLRNLPFTNE